MFVYHFPEEAQPINILCHLAVWYRERCLDLESARSGFRSFHLASEAVGY